MGWFDEQIRERKRQDNERFADAMDEISAIITREKIELSCDEGETTKQESITRAIGRVLRYYHIKPKEVPDDIKNLQEQLEYLCRPYGVMRRTVKLEKGWYKDAIGALLGTRKDGTVVALLPRRFFGYSYYDETTGREVRLSSTTEEDIEETAICFYKPFPAKKLNIPTMLRYVIGCVQVSAYGLVIIMMLLTTLVGMLSPRITHIIFDEVIPSESMRLFWAVIVFSVCLSISTMLMGILKSLIDGRVSTQMSMSIQSATMARVLSLPAEFFKKYSAGELSTKLQYFNSLCSTLYSSFMVTGLGSIFSLIYITQVFTYAPALVFPSLCITVATLGFSIFNTFIRMKNSRQSMEVSGKKNGLTYALLTGIQKIKLSGSERRAFTRWTKVYAEEVRTTYGIPLSILLSGTIGMVISLTGTIVMYYFAVQSGVSVADYYAFTAAYGMVSGAFSSLVGIGLQAANIRPTLEQVKPIMEAVPEISEDKKVVTRVSGGIELNNVSFRYNESMPWVLDNLSLKIKPGQYVAIVGKTGCGKSTLLRLLLGFETAQKGAVYYDGKNIDTLDLKSLRKKIGVVMQNGKLFHGDIFSNITIAAPWLTLGDAWEAAELADIAEDIRAMPMGMHTIIAEGSGGISGGQRQRLMIARAIAPKPKILMFDEATSALDNITQRKVSEALDGLKCTRIVIAHRLSTIRHCDRIIVLDGGKIIEDGTYDELLAMDGFFTELVKRQRINIS
ncbi:MAG: ATP-binding cassette domain-containing protein [Lachnospiraceae bacterium]|nr:ATP-binding cassette domain-containing protein [Lachnospiraceae bacterium]